MLKGFDFANMSEPKPLDDELKAMRKKMEDKHSKLKLAETAYMREAGNFSRALASKGYLLEPTAQRKKRAQAEDAPVAAVASDEPPKKRGRGKKAKEDKK